MKLDRRLPLSMALALGAAAAGTALAGPPPGWVPLYSYIYYSDASHSTVVGEHGGVCYGQPGSVYAGVTQFPSGTVTAYVEQIQIGRCMQDGTTVYE